MLVMRGEVDNIQVTRNPHARPLKLTNDREAKERRGNIQDLDTLIANLTCWYSLGESYLFLSRQTSTVMTTSLLAGHCSPSTANSSSSRRTPPKARRLGVGTGDTYNIRTREVIKQVCSAEDDGL